MSGTFPNTLIKRSQRFPHPSGVWRDKVTGGGRIIYSVYISDMIEIFYCHFVLFLLF